MVIYGAAVNTAAANAFTPPAGYTEAFDVNANGYSSTVGYKPIAATGNESGTISWASNTYAAAVASLNPDTGTITSPITVLDAWPATPQLTALNGNLSGTFSYFNGQQPAAGGNRCRSG